MATFRVIFLLAMAVMFWAFTAEAEVTREKPAESLTHKAREASLELSRAERQWLQTARVVEGFDLGRLLTIFSDGVRRS